MEHRKAPTPNITMIDSTNNNNSHSHNRRKKRTAKRQQLPSPSKDQHVSSLIMTDSNSNQEKICVREQQQEYMPIKTPLAWTKKWTKWFSSCGSERLSHTDLKAVTVTTKVS
jgi:hypothetical protein